MSRFKESVERFRVAVHREGERSVAPGFQELLMRERKATGVRLRWAVAAGVVAMLGAVPVYRGERERQRAAEQERADALLMEQIDAGLGRSAAEAMASATWAQQPDAPMYQQMQQQMLRQLADRLRQAQQAQQPDAQTVSKQEVLDRFRQRRVLDQDQLVAERARQADLRAELEANRALEATLRANLARLRERYSESYPEVAAARMKLEELQLRERQLREMSIEAVLRDAEKPAGDAPKIMLPDRWWKNPATAQFVGLTAEQQRKMDDVFQQYRDRLMVLNADLQREEASLTPLVSAEPLDEAKIAMQIDRVAQARAELEKANGRMLLGIRKLLMSEQWTRLNQGFSMKP